jgi:hypothetical protein
MAIYLGRGGSWGIGVESTYGTPVSITNWLQMISMDLSSKQILTPVDQLLKLGGSANYNRMHAGFIESGGSASMLMSYDDSTLLLLEHLMGSVVDAGAGPYTHTFTLSAALPTSLTIEQIKGETDGAAASTKEVFEGVRLTSGVLKIEAGGAMTLDVEAIAETSAARASASTPSYTSGGNCILHHQASQFNWNSVNYDLISMTITVDNKLTRRQILGSKETKSPHRSDATDVMIEVTIAYETDALHIAQLAQTQSDCTLTLTGTGNNVMAITGHNAEIEDLTDPVSSRGLIVQTVRFRCLDDGTNEGLSIVVTNDNATAVTN